LLKSVNGHPQSCQAVLQPLSLTTATLSFLSSAYDGNQLTLDEIIDELIDVPSNSSTDGESALPHFFNSGMFQCCSQYFNRLELNFGNLGYLCYYLVLAGR